MRSPAKGVGGEEPPRRFKSSRLRVIRAASNVGRGPRCFGINFSARRILGCPEFGYFTFKVFLDLYSEGPSGVDGARRSGANESPSLK